MNTTKATIIDYCNRYLVLRDKTAQPMEFLEGIIPLLKDCDWISVGSSDARTMTLATGDGESYCFECELAATLLRMLCVKLAVIARQHGHDVNLYGGRYELCMVDEAKRWPKFRAEFENSPGQQKFLLSRIA